MHPKSEDTRTHVLLVEDSPGDVRLIREALCAVNSSVVVQVATDGAEAMAFLGREGSYADAPRPKLILLDLNLPKVDGREILNYLKSDDDLLSIPTVIITASDKEADAEKCYQSKANCYFEKPKHLQAFRELVHDINHFFILGATTASQKIGV